MKNILFLIVLSAGFSSCTGQNKNVHFAKQPLQLSGFNFDLDIPNFFNDEAVFRGKGDVSMQASEEEVERNDQDKPFKYVRYGQYSSTSKIKVAAYKDFMFREMLLCTDSADEKTYLVAAEQSYLKPEDIDKLVALLKKDLGSPTPMSQIERKNEDVSYEWHLKDKVVKLVLNVERDEDDETFSGDWQRKAYSKEEKITARLFIATKQFDQVMNEASSFTGMLVDYR